MRVGQLLRNAKRLLHLGVIANPGEKQRHVADVSLPQPKCNAATEFLRAAAAKERSSEVSTSRRLQRKSLYKSF